MNCGRCGTEAEGCQVCGLFFCPSCHPFGHQCELEESYSADELGCDPEAKWAGDPEIWFPGGLPPIDVIPPELPNA